MVICGEWYVGEFVKGLSLMYGPLLGPWDGLSSGIEKETRRPLVGLPGFKR